MENYGKLSLNYHQTSTSTPYLSSPGWDRNIFLPSASHISSFSHWTFLTTSRRIHGSYAHLGPMERKTVQKSIKFKQWIGKVCYYIYSRQTCLRWTYFRPSRFILQWTTIVHATLCISDITDKWNKLTRQRNVRLTSHHAEGCWKNIQTCRLITFLHHLLHNIYIKTSQIMNKSDVKIKSKYGMNFIFLTFIEVWMQLLPCTRPIAFKLQ